MISPCKCWSLGLFTCPWCLLFLTQQGASQVTGMKALISSSYITQVDCTRKIEPGPITENASVKTTPPLPKLSLNQSARTDKHAQPLIEDPVQVHMGQAEQVTVKGKETWTPWQPEWAEGKTMSRSHGSGQRSHGACRDPENFREEATFGLDLKEIGKKIDKKTR